MVGINLSPLILNYSMNRELVVQSLHKMIDYILDNTQMNIVLVPHVFDLTDSGSDDISVMQPIYDAFKDSERIVFLNDRSLNCKQLKGYISRCRFFIGARTHSIIAAYSTGVPAIALGYSVKAKGIARDLFGSEENLVLPVQTFDSPQLSVKAIQYLIEKEEDIKALYAERLPQYIEKAKDSARLLADLIDGE